MLSVNAHKQKKNQVRQFFIVGCIKFQTRFIFYF